MIPLTRFTNRGFELPEDGWLQLVPKGEFPHAESGTVQIVDNEACATLVRNFRGTDVVPVDFDHFSYDEKRPVEWAGKVAALENRAGGVWGRIDWTKVGRERVEGGAYRFVSPSFVQLEELGGNRVRPIRLDSIGLTNAPNMRGKPICNRGGRSAGERFTLGARASEPSSERYLRFKFHAVDCECARNPFEAAAGIKSLTNRAMAKGLAFQAAHDSVTRAHPDLVRMAMEYGTRDDRRVYDESLRNRAAEVQRSIRNRAFDPETAKPSEFGRVLTPPAQIDEMAEEMLGRQLAERLRDTAELPTHMNLRNLRLVFDKLRVEARKAGVKGGFADEWDWVRATYPLLFECYVCMNEAGEVSYTLEPR